MAKLFLIVVGNLLDDTNYSVPVIAPEGYTDRDIDMAISCNDVKLNLSDYCGEFVKSISQIKPLFSAFDESDYIEIAPILRQFKVN